VKFLEQCKNAHYGMPKGNIQILYLALCIKTQKYKFVFITASVCMFKLRNKVLHY